MQPDAYPFAGRVQAGVRTRRFHVRVGGRTLSGETADTFEQARATAEWCLKRYPGQLVHVIDIQRRKAWQIR